MYLGKSFGSDNHSGVHPEVMQAINKCNEGHQAAYGADSYSQGLNKLFSQKFEANAQVFLVFTGTAANTLAIRSSCKSYEAVVTSSIAHLNQDECGAPEFNSGNKILSFPHHNGKISPATIKQLRIQPDDPHRVLPRLVSITQATEVGTVYSIDEIKAIATTAHERKMLVHMDGARLANAAAFLNCELADLSSKAGVDILSFGGTKNGLLCAEAVVIFKPELAADFAYYRKQSMQLASKMRYLACQFEAYFSDNLWGRNAKAANSMALYLREKLSGIATSYFPYPTEANEVFVKLPDKISQIMQERASAMVWDRATGLLRFVTSYDSSPADIDYLLDGIKF